MPHLHAQREAIKVQIVAIARKLRLLGEPPSKDLMKSIPKLVKDSVSKEEAADTKVKLEVAGDKIEMK